MALAAHPGGVVGPTSTAPWRTPWSVFPSAEKAAMVQRVLSAFGSVGVDQVLVGAKLRRHRP